MTDDTIKIDAEMVEAKGIPVDVLPGDPEAPLGTLPVPVQGGISLEETDWKIDVEIGSQVETWAQTVHAGERSGEIPLDRLPDLTGLIAAAIRDNPEVQVAILGRLLAEGVPMIDTSTLPKGPLVPNKGQTVPAGDGFPDYSGA